MAIRADRRREAIQAGLSEALTEAADGGGRLVLVLGEAGIGKTTTAREVATLARRRGFAVRWAAAWSGGATVAHAPWLSLLSGLGAPGSRAIHALLACDTTDASAATSARAAAYSQVVAAIEEATLERPALIVLDDLHWADEGTIGLLDAVAGHAPGLSVLIVGTYRDTDTAPGSPLTRLGGGVDRLELRGLDQDAVAALIGDQTDASTGSAIAEDVIRLTAGNPFLVVQVARMLAEEPGGDRRGVMLPSGARDLLQQRIDALNPADRTTVVAGAVLGATFRVADLAALCDVEAKDISAALDRAAAVRIVERSSGTSSWAFTHDLWRQAALAHPEAGDLPKLHRRAAQVLDAAGAEVAEIAAHLFAAGDDDAAVWAVRAGDRAISALAWEEAIGHYSAALAGLAPVTAGTAVEVRADALAGLGRSHILAGAPAAAADAFEQLAELGRTVGSPTMVARAALGFSADLSGFEVRLFDDRQVALLEDADRRLAGLDPSDPSVVGLRSTVLARLSVAQSMVASANRRLALAEEAVDLARAADDPTVLARALAAHCDAIAGPDHSEQREVEASEIIDIAVVAGDGPLELLGRRLRFVARLEAGDVDGVTEDRIGYARRAAAVGNPLYSWFVWLWEGQAALVAGDLATTARCIDEVEALGWASGSTNAPMLATVLRLVADWEREDAAAAVARMESMGIVSPELTPYISAIGGITWAAIVAHQPDKARSYLDRAATIESQLGHMDAEWLSNLVNLVRASAALDHPMLSTVLPMLEPYAHRVAFEGIGAGLYGSVARFVALGCRAQGRGDDAVRYAEQAVAVNRRFGGALHADALRTLADCLEDRGDDAAVVESLHREADAAYTAVSATHLLRTASATTSESKGAVAEPASMAESGGVFARSHDVWHIDFGGQTSVVKHTKGMADLALLLERPGTEVHVSEMEQGVVVNVSQQDILDRRAIAAYRDRLAELAEEIADADAAHDLARAERARTEYDFLVDQLTHATGLGGRKRSVGSVPVERLRKAVSARIRDAISRIADTDPALGRHLDNAIRTGTFCSYQPETRIRWRLRAKTPS